MLDGTHFESPSLLRRSHNPYPPFEVSFKSEPITVTFPVGMNVILQRNRYWQSLIRWAQREDWSRVLLPVENPATEKMQVVVICVDRSNDIYRIWFCNTGPVPLMSSFYGNQGKRSSSVRYTRH